MLLLRDNEGIACIGDRQVNMRQDIGEWEFNNLGRRNLERILSNLIASLEETLNTFFLRVIVCHRSFILLTAMVSNTNKTDKTTDHICFVSSVHYCIIVKQSNSTRVGILRMWCIS